MKKYIVLVVVIILILVSGAIYLLNRNVSKSTGVFKDEAFSIFEANKDSFKYISAELLKFNYDIQIWQDSKTKDLIVHTNYNNKSLSINQFEFDNETKDLIIFLFNKLKIVNIYKDYQTNQIDYDFNSDNQTGVYFIINSKQKYHAAEYYEFEEDWSLNLKIKNQ